MCFIKARCDGDSSPSGVMTIVPGVQSPSLRVEALRPEWSGLHAQQQRRQKIEVLAGS